MKIDMTKVANATLYMVEKGVMHLNDKKLSIMLFLMDLNHLENCGEKIFNEEYIKEKRNPEPKLLSDIFDIIANDIDLDDEDERIFLITELLDFVDIELHNKEKFIELKFIKYEEDFDESLFSKDEMKTIDKVISKYKDTTPRKIANACFQNERVRATKLGDIII